MKVAKAKLWIISCMVLMIVIGIVPSRLTAQDLVVKSVQGIPANLLWNDPVPLLTVVIENKGTAPASPLMIAVTCKRTYNGATSNGPIGFSKHWPNYYQPPLNPGETKEFKQTLWPGADNGRLELGKHHIIVNVDPLNKESESNENNNQYTVDFEVKYGTVKVMSISLNGINYTGPCPKNHLEIAKGMITAVQGSGLIRWHYITSWDTPGKQPYIYESRFKEGDSYPIGMVSVAQGNFTGWVQLKIVYPEERLTNKANFEIKCVKGVDIKKIIPPKVIIVPKKIK